MNVVWTTELLTTLRDHYDAGLTYRQIAAVMGMTRDTVGSQLATRGFCSRSNDGWWTADRLELLQLRYLCGDSLSQIGRALATTRSAVAGKIKRLGLVRDPTVPLKGSVRDDLQRAKATSLRRVKSKQLKPAPIPIETRRVSFADMQFSKFCAYPVHGEGEAPLYCGLAKGLTAEGKPSSYCPGHHALAYQPRRGRA